MFDQLKANIPTGFRMIHQQPVDEKDTEGEVPLERMLVTLNKGRLAVSNLNSNQQVGDSRILNFYTGAGITNLLVYRGREPGTTNVHRFEIRTSLTSSSFLARILAQDDLDGDGVNLEVLSGSSNFKFNAGIFWQYRFTVPIFRPPAAPGTVLNSRVELISQPWLSLAGSQMRIQNN